MELITNEYIEYDEGYPVFNIGRLKERAIRPRSHFFLQTNGVAITQSSSDSFGVVSDTEFKTTSKLTFNGDLKVYSICKGQILIQPNSSNSSLVNLILKPFNQPFRSMPIKYFIYRGLNYSDFFTSDTVPKLIGDENTGSIFIKQLWAAFNSFYSNLNSGTPNPEFLASYLGMPSTSNPQSISSKIDEWFYCLSQTTQDPISGVINEPELLAFELPIISRGIELGTASNDIGLDIVLDNCCLSQTSSLEPFSLDLEFARSEEYILDTTNLIDVYQKRLLKEACTQFIDAAAFYGLHASEKGKIYYDNQSTPHSTPTSIKTLLSPFATDESLYLYINSNLGRSYNFYGNYEIGSPTFNNIKFDFASPISNETVFGTDGWPILKISVSNIQEPKLFMQLVLENEYEGVVLYSNLGGLQTENSEYFMTQTELLPSTISQSFEYGNEIHIKLNAIPSGSAYSGISGLINLIYQGAEYSPNILPSNLEPDQIYNFNNFKELFASPTLISNLDSSQKFNFICFQPTNIVKYGFSGVYAEQTECLVKKSIIFEDIINPSNDNIVRRVSFISQAENLSKKLNSKNSLSSKARYDSIVLDNQHYFNIAYGKENCIIKHYNIEDNSNLFKIFDLYVDGNVENGFFTLGITQNELDTLVALIPNNAFNVRFFIANQDNTRIYDTIYDIPIQKFALGILYEDNLGDLQVLRPSQDILIYGNSIAYLTTIDYSNLENRFS